MAYFQRTVRDVLRGVFRRDPTPQRDISTGLAAAPIAEIVAVWILTATLERFLMLKVVLAEPGSGWPLWLTDCHAGQTADRILANTQCRSSPPPALAV